MSRRGHFSFNLQRWSYADQNNKGVIKSNGILESPQLQTFLSHLFSENEPVTAFLRNVIRSRMQAIPVCLVYMFCYWESVHIQQTQLLIGNLGHNIEAWLVLAENSSSGHLTYLGNKRIRFLGPWGFAFCLEMARPPPGGTVSRSLQSGRAEWGTHCVLGMLWLLCLSMWTLSQIRWKELASFDVH